MNQPTGNLAVDVHDELNKAIEELAAGTAKPSPVKPPPLAEAYPFRMGHSTAESLRAAAAAERPAGEPDERRAPMVAAVSGASEVERFMAQGDRLLDVQRKKIIALESAYELSRVRLIDDYRVKLRDLEHEASEALRSFDHKHQAEAQDAKRILDALTAMRG